MQKQIKLMIENSPHFGESYMVRKNKETHILFILLIRNTNSNNFSVNKGDFYARNFHKP